MKHRVVNGAVHYRYSKYTFELAEIQQFLQKRINTSIIVAKQYGEECPDIAMSLSKLPIPAVHTLSPIMFVTKNGFIKSEETGEVRMHDALWKILRQFMYNKDDLAEIKEKYLITDDVMKLVTSTSTMTTFVVDGGVEVGGVLLNPEKVLFQMIMEEAGKNQKECCKYYVKIEEELSTTIASMSDLGLPWLHEKQLEDDHTTYTCRFLPKAVYTDTSRYCNHCV